MTNSAPPLARTCGVRDPSTSNLSTAVRVDLNLCFGDVTIGDDGIRNKYPGKNASALSGMAYMISREVGKPGKPRKVGKSKIPKSRKVKKM